MEGFRLSPQQKRLWRQHTGQNWPYRAQALILIEGDLHAERLSAAIQEVVTKHEILRTTFHRLPGLTLPVQVITDHGLPSVQDYDFTGLDAREQHARVEALIEATRSRPFDFERGPLWHLSLIKLSSDAHLLLVVLPALCADTIGLYNLMRELGSAYAAGGRCPDSAQDVLQYADIAEWQNELLEGEEGEAGRAFWRGQKIAPWFSVKLPGEKLLSEPTDFEPQAVHWTVPSDLRSQLEALAIAHQTSISVVLLAGWLVLIGRLTGQSDLVIGLGGDGRKYDELRTALGLLAKYLPFPCRLDADASFRDIVIRVQDAAHALYEWEEFFSWEYLEPFVENHDRPAFFPICYDFTEQPAPLSAANVSFSLLQHTVYIDRFKVRLACVQQGDALNVTFDYNAHDYRAEAIQRLAEQFQTLLADAVRRPDAAFRELEMLSETQRQQVLVEFNQTRADVPADRCIHHLIEEQAARTPTAVAVKGNGQTLTYAELNAQAGLLARHLRSLGVGPGVLVGICLERSLETIVGILGILKANGAYVPLDPTYPQERLSFMLRDTQAPVLLTQQRLLEGLPEHHAQVVCLDQWMANESRGRGINESTDSWAPVPLDRFDRDVTVDSPAYVIYTSGSTGRPKGVLVTHRNLVHSTLARLTYYRQPVRGFLLLSSYAFDSSVAGIFWTLCQGGALVLPQSGLERDPSRLAALIAEHRISHLLSLPSLYSLLLAQSQPEQLASLQTVIVAGEACPEALTESHHRILPGAELFNEYGPTEGTVWSSVYQIRSPIVGGPVPIGRPIANTQIYLLDERLRPLPIGVAGELYIGGLGVAQGYLNRPELTAERFIPHPFSSEPGARLYKTGDWGRYRSDGTIEFLGRLDDQVKIRGYRIELGEVEAVLTQHPAVREAVVVAREDEPDQKRLVAYVVANVEPPTTSELRRFLKEKLPEYMVPATFVMLEALPRLPNGKVDRRALPMSDQARATLDTAFVAPRTPIEKILAEIWSEVLGITPIGVYDNFFDLGGDSILSLRIVAKANQVGLSMVPMQIFQHQTIAALAGVVGATRTIKAEQGEIVGHVPLTPIQRWFFEQDPIDPQHANMAMLLEVRQPLNWAWLEQALRHLLRHHDGLRLRFVRDASGWQQFIAASDESAPFTRVDLSEQSQAEQQEVMAAAAAALHASLDLSQGPLLRLALFDLGKQQPSRLLIVIHHLAVDAVSWQIFLEDLQTAYQQLSRGEPIKLPPKTTSFKYWAERLAEYAQVEALEQAKSYWLTMPWSRVTPLPVDYPAADDANTVASARTLSVWLDVEETRMLLQQVPKVYRTQINDVLLTALVQAFCRWTGASSLLIDLEGHGREDLFTEVDISRTVGWFTSLFPVLLEMDCTSDPGQALTSIKEQLRRIPDRGLSYGLLRYLSRDADVIQKLQTLPRPQVNFNYLGQFDQILPDSPLFGLARESSGPDRSPRGRRTHLLEVVGFVLDGRLQMDWTYSEKIHRQATVEQLAQEFVQALRSLIAHCQSPEAGGYTPSDFPEADLTPEELEDLLAVINEPVQES